MRKRKRERERERKRERWGGGENQKYGGEVDKREKKNPTTNTQIHTLICW